MATFENLNQKQTVFVTEYIKDFNGTQAAIRAGYAKKTAGAIASENLTKPEIKSAINKLLTEIINDNKDIAVKTIRECQKIAFSRISDYMEYDDNGMVLKPSSEIDDSAIESITFDITSNDSGYNSKKRVKLHDKLKALEILAKYTSLYKESPDINVNSIIYLDKQDEAL